MNLPSKISLFSFLSAVTCMIGYLFLGLDLLLIITDVLWFVAYTSFFSGICQKGYEKNKISINFIITIMSVSMAIYMGVYGSVTENKFFVEYCIYAAYLLSIICIVNTIIWIGIRIFSNTPKKDTENVPDKEIEKDQTGENKNGPN